MKIKKSVQNCIFCTGDRIFGSIVKIGYFALYPKNASKSWFSVGNVSTKHVCGLGWYFGLFRTQKNMIICTLPVSEVIFRKKCIFWRFWSIFDDFGLFLSSKCSKKSKILQNLPKNVVITSSKDSYSAFVPGSSLVWHEKHSDTWYIFKIEKIADFRKNGLKNGRNSDFW